MRNNLKDDPRYSNHESRPDLAGEHPQGDFFQLLIFLLFAAVVLIDHFLLGWAAECRSFVPFGIRLPISLALILVGLYMAFEGIHMVFSEYTEQPRMVTSGLFSLMRHPVYLGALIIYVGLLVLILSPLAFLAFLGAILLYNWLALDEERRMQIVFGDQYKSYCQQTPRWLPRLNSRNKKIRR